MIQFDNIVKRGSAWLVVLICILLILTTGCSSDNDEPREVKWNRDACERCGMVLSDRHNSAQIRYQQQDGKYHKVVLFDDFGCAVLWLEEQPWKDDSKTEFWITDHRNGEWINAHQATYLPGQLTPMQYGLGAQLDWREGGLSYDQAVEFVHGIEQRFNSRSAQLLDRYREQAAQREAHRQEHRDDADLQSISPVEE